MYLLIVAMAALHYNFPYDRILVQAAANLESRGPVKLDFGSPERKLPFAVRVPDVNIGIAWPEGTYPLIKQDRVDLSFRTWAILLGRIRVDIESGKDNKNLHGKMVMGLFGDSDLRLELDQIDLPQFVFTDPSGKTAVTGRLTGSVSVKGNKTVFPKAGQGRLVLESGKITGLNIPNLPIRDFDFDRIELEFELEKKRCDHKKSPRPGTSNRNETDRAGYKLSATYAQPERIGAPGAGKQPPGLGNISNYRFRCKSQGRHHIGQRTLPAASGHFRQLAMSV